MFKNMFVFNGVFFWCWLTMVISNRSVPWLRPPDHRRSTDHPWAKWRQRLEGALGPWGPAVRGQRCLTSTAGHSEHQVENPKFSVSDGHFCFQWVMIGPFEAPVKPPFAGDLQWEAEGISHRNVTPPASPDGYDGCPPFNEFLCVIQLWDAVEPMSPTALRRLALGSGGMRSFLQLFLMFTST